MPKFSIIVPVYNCITYLSACVDSILRQTVQDFELLLVDDGATDGSGKLCDELAREYDCIRVFHKANGGAASARNVGIENAAGEYLLFIDGDDTVEPELLARMEAAMDGAELAIYGMAFDYYGKTDTIERTALLSCQHSGRYAADDIIKGFHTFFEDNALSSACNKCFCGEIIRENALCFIEGMTLYEDLEFVLRYLKEIRMVSCVGEALYHYRLSAEEKHLKSRVADLSSLRTNLARLNGTLLSFSSKETASTAANLYLQMLWRNLREHPRGPGEMRDAAEPYCGERTFRTALERGAVLGKTESAMLSLIDENQYLLLFGKLRIETAKSWIKGQLKRCLKVVGLYH